jgi:hypothetical protein
MGRALTLNKRYAKSVIRRIGKRILGNRERDLNGGVRKVRLH